MKHFYIIFVMSLFFVFFCISIFNQSTKISDNYKLPNFKTENIMDLFPKNIDEVNSLAKLAIEEAQNSLKLIYDAKDQEYNFKNIMLLFDRTTANFSYKFSTLYVLTMVHPDQEMREIAQKSVMELQKFSIDQFSQNKKLYQIFKKYNENKIALSEKIADFEEYFIKETLDSYQKAGLEKDDQTRELIKSITQELGVLSLDFDKNINSDNRFIKVSKEELKGVDGEFVESLKKDQDSYILGVDYPTVFKIFEECEIESTRKALWYEFNLRGYPANKEVLHKIIVLRDQLAKVLGFDSYAHMDIADQMAKTPTNVINFLNDISDKCKLKVSQEIEVLKKDLPISIDLVENKFKPWDFKFVVNYYNKKYMELDENLISQYFPTDYTLKALLDIYEQFFGLKFERSNVQNLWNEDVQALKVYKDNKFIGTLLLDLWPRDNKYTHACQVGIVSSVRDKNYDIISPAVVLVIANFTKPQKDKPALLRRKEVTTFFHECGHAIHSLLGSTELANQSGTSVKGDFVEMPSQMLEEWMTDKEVLRSISKHYVTGEKLPDNIIESIQKNQNALIASYLLGQVAYSLISLNLFDKGESKNIDLIWKDAHDLLSEVTYGCSDYGYCSFGHLTGYGPKYYGYLWSKIYAKDLFSKIKEHGLFNREIGELYAQKILAKGGSQDPNELLKDFLSRETSSEAFFKDCGL